MAATDDHSLRTAVAALGGAGEAVVVADAERLHIVAANDTALALLGSIRSGITSPGCCPTSSPRICSIGSPRS